MGGNLQRVFRKHIYIALFVNKILKFNLAIGIRAHIWQRTFLTVPEIINRQQFEIIQLGFIKGREENRRDPMGSLKLCRKYSIKIELFTVIEISIYV